MTNTISNMDDTIDSRDVIERIAELQDERDALQDAYDVADTADASDAARRALDNWEDAEELTALQALQGDASGYCPDWTYGAQLIRDSYFEQAMDEMIADCYTLPEIPSFMTITLDYTALQQDYTACDFDGVTYWVR